MNTTNTTNLSSGLGETNTSSPALALETSSEFYNFTSISDSLLPSLNTTTNTSFFDTTNLISISMPSASTSSHQATTISISNESSTTGFVVVMSTTTSKSLSLKIVFGKVLDTTVNTAVTESSSSLTPVVHPDTCYLPIADNMTNVPNYCIEMSENGTVCAACVGGFELVNHSCVQCKSGFFKNEYVARCTMCEPGKTTLNASGQDRCFACEANTSTFGVAGSQFCYPCPPHSEAPRKGMAACECLGPRFANGTACDYCVPGTYDAGEQQVLVWPPRVGQCASCRGGAYSTGVGLSSCLNCSRGFYSNASQTYCEACPAGLYNPEEGGACRGCYAHGIAPFSGMWFCECVPGFFRQGQSCRGCPAGSYGVLSTSISGGVCVECGVGTYTDREASMGCAPCPVATFNALQNQTACEACPAFGTTLGVGRTRSEECVCLPGSIASTTSGCAECDAGSYQPLLNGSVCVACEPGTFSGVRGRKEEECEACPLNFYAHDYGSTYCFACVMGVTLARKSTSFHDCLCVPGAGRVNGSCASCPRGTYQPHVNITCLPCEVGKYAVEEGWKYPCFFCRAGTYSGVEGATHCAECEVGGSTTVGIGSTSSDECVCQPGFAFASGECAPCGAGKYQPVFNGTCLECDAGKYAVHVGQTSVLGCSLCPQGSYNPQRGQTACLSCGDPVSTFTLREGQVSASDCLCKPGSFKRLFPDEMFPCAPCAAGTFQYDLNQTSCIACQPGKYADDAGRSNDCDGCVQGKYASASASTACDRCPVFSSNVGVGGSDPAQCVCLDGYFSYYGQCMPCSAGFYRFNQDQASCRACQPGKYADDAGRPRDCEWCVQGKYASASASTACSQCPVFSNNAGVGGSDLAQCVCLDGFVMYYGQCVPCPVGTFQPMLNGSECYPCIQYAYNNQSGSRLCDVCLAGSSKVMKPSRMHGFLVNFTCAPCRAGTFQALNDSSQCDVCPNNTFAPEQGSTVCAVCPAQTSSGRGSDKCLSCPANSFSSGGGQECMCKDGFVMDAGSKTCTECERGTFQASKEHTFCTLCPMGSFAPDPGTFGGCFFCKVDTFNTCGGMSFCEACPPNSSTQSRLGSVACTCDAGFNRYEGGCRGCDAGTYSSSPDQPCAACSAGTFSGLTGASACVACAAAVYAFGEGNTACVGCTNGSRVNAAMTRCECPSGFFNRSGACVPCKSNCSSDREFLRVFCYGEFDNVCEQCRETCPLNFYIRRKCTLASNAECWPCAKECVKGFYRRSECNKTHNLDCAPCRSTCPPDSIRTGLCFSSDFECAACEAGVSFPDPISKRFCVSCPPDHYIYFNGSHHECRNCVNEYLLSANKTMGCVLQCKAGEYPSGPNTCSFCPLNTYGLDGQTCQTCPSPFNCEKRLVGLTACLPCDSLATDSFEKVVSDVCVVA